MASHTQDDGFREIQLNGKQLVFVFMAATVVSVVIFLCGVLVGRGVRVERDMVASTTEPTVSDIKPNLPVPERPPTVVAPAQDPTKALPPDPPAGDAQRGGSAIVTPASAPPAKADATLPPAPVAAAPQPAAAASKAEPAPRIEPVAPKGEPAAPKAAAKTEPSPKLASDLPTVDDPRRGWVVQVAAVKTRDEADGMAKDLGAKGYTAFVLTGESNVFRVRVGGYKSKRDAETVAAKLRKEERITPWVTR